MGRAFGIIVLAIGIGTGLFAGLDLYRFAGNPSMSAGADPWSALFSRLGGVAAPALVALILAGVWKLFSRGASFINIWLIMFVISAGVMGWSYFSVIIYEKDAPASASIRVDAAEWVRTVAPSYGDVGSCPISADFINEPEVLENVTRLAGMEVSSTTKRSFIRGAMVSIECTELPPEKVFPGASDASILQNYARFWSIEPIDDGNGGISEHSDPVRHFKLTGTKTIQGIEVTYSYRLFRFSSSFAMVAVGVPSDTSDRSEIEHFLGSLRIEEEIREFSEREKLVGRKNHMASCLPAIRADNEKRQLGLTELEISFFCSCTGVRYFDKFTRAELRTIALGDDPALAERREKIQVECFQEAIK